MLAPVAPRIARGGETLRRRTVQTGTEFAALIDAATGALVGPPLEGQEEHVDLAPQMAALRPGRRYLHLHTHPASSSFSDLDLRVFLRHPELRHMAVVGQDGSWYLASKQRGRPSASVAVGLARWSHWFDEIAASDDEQLARGRLTTAQALRRELHETMVRLAPEIGLRYDHLEA
jgi:hypothetical protein